MKTQAEHATKKYTTDIATLLLNK